MIRWKIPLVLVGTRWAVSKLGRGHGPEPGLRPGSRPGPRLDFHPGPRRGRGLLPWAVAGAVIGISASALAGPGSTRLAGKVALITGGSRGIGLQMAREFGARDASVVVCARDLDELARAVADLRRRGVRAHGIQCDVRDPEQVTMMVEEAAHHFGRLDFVVNNAGIIQVGPQSTFTERHFQDAMDTMFWAPLHVSRAALGPLGVTGGSLVNITSIGGHLSVPHLLPYSCAKFAEVALSEGLGAEVARTGVRVTTVVPGLMRTGSHKAAVFTGRPEREYAWFSLGAGLPLVSVGSERAARRIVDAAARGRSYLVLTPLARVVIVFRGLCPSLTQGVTRLMGRMLPEPSGQSEERTGREADRGLVNQVLKIPTVLNERASRRLNQYPEPG